MTKENAIELFENRKRKNASISEKNLDRLFTDWNDLHDYIIPINQTEFHYLQAENKVSSGISNEITGKHTFLSDNAMSQLGAKLGIPSSWLKKSIKGSEWEREMISNVLEAYRSNYRKTKDNAFLFRIVGNEIRAILSPMYEIYNSIGLYADIAKSAKDYGLELYQLDYNGYGTNMNYIYPEPFAVDLNGETEWVQYGINIQNSDFGTSAFTMGTFLSVVVCDNGLISNKQVRRIHRGKSKGEELKILSRDTRNAIQIATEKELRDHFDYFAKAEAIEAAIMKFKEAGTLRVDMDATLEKISKTIITKEEMNDLKSLLLNRPEEANIGNSGGNYNTIIQGITYMANSKKELESKIELQELAGDMVWNSKKYAVHGKN